MVGVGSIVCILTGSSAPPPPSPNKSWAPIQGRSNYALNGATVSVTGSLDGRMPTTNYTTDGVEATPYQILGTPGKGDNRLGT
jgi:hypothetical protein